MLGRVPARGAKQSSYALTTEACSGSTATTGTPTAGAPRRRTGIKAPAPALSQCADLAHAGASVLAAVSTGGPAARPDRALRGGGGGLRLSQ